MLADMLFVVLAILLLVVGVRGLLSGAYAFSHDERLAVTRDSEPVWYWIQACLIFGTAALLLWAVSY